MHSRPLLAVLGTAALLAACPRGAPTHSGTADQPSPREVISDTFSDDQLVSLLTAFGYEPALIEDGSIHFELGSGQVMLFNHWEGDLQLYYVMTGGSWEPPEINTWNRTRRHSRAYVDSEGDLVLEADLLALGGVTERQVASFVMLFEKTLELFSVEVVTPGIERVPLGERDLPERVPDTPSGWH